jgi:outer membrane protein
MKGGDMRKLLTLTVIITGIFLFQQNVPAAESCKIGIVNYQRCWQESNEGKRLSQGLFDKGNEMQEELEKKQLELEEMEKEIQKQSLMLSLDAREDKEDEYNTMQRDLEYLVEDSNELWTKMQTEAQQTFLTALQDIIVDIAGKDGYDLIMESLSGGILFSSEAIDITDKVIDALNKAKP